MLAWAEYLSPTPVLPVGPYVVLALPRDALFTRACELVAEQDARWPERSGEAKRHQVLAKLRDEHTDPTQALALAIEAAVKEIH